MSAPVIILGLNAYHGDSSACIVIDGQLVAAVEEERFKRIKHWAGFPVQSIQYCLKATNKRIEDIDFIAINRAPWANLTRKIIYSFAHKPSIKAVISRLQNAVKINRIRATLSESLGVKLRSLKAHIYQIEHHRAHLASTFFVSPFNSAAVVSVDGFGDFVSTMWGIGKGRFILVKKQVLFPHSLGLFYLAMTQYLGFPKYGDEYKAMGLAAYGKPTEIKKIRQLVNLIPNGKYELNLDYFLHHSKGVTMVWENEEPSLSNVYSDKIIDLLGSPRKPNEPILEYHKNIAASVQLMYEDAFFHFLNHVYTKTRNPNLCLSGGCAFNSVANGKIYERTLFRKIYVQCAAGDAGGAIGAAFYVWNQIMRNRRSFTMNHSYWGPEYEKAEIKNVLLAKQTDLIAKKCSVENVDNEDALCKKTVEALIQGKIVGWFQGRMEWGPRALGNRSILCDPRNKNMKEVLNRRIKRRDEFRPFAPVILRECVHEWFETDSDVPFMTQVYQIRPEKRKFIPAVTHVDGSGRLQTITAEQNSKYYKLISEFKRLTNVPILLNTSFNENEPIVCSPYEAIDCFLRTKMDVLVIGNYFILRS